jgi:NAD(P)-dependent dehydrogenase (short-subunit alcohol dehydrogenase family)
MESFTGKVVVVTGAGSGIGRATALAFGRTGAIVHAVDLDGPSAEATAAAVGEHGRAHTVDVTDAEAVAALAATVYARDGRVDVLHNNAGIGVSGDVEEIPLAAWRRVVEVNVMGVVHGVHAFLPRMLGQGGGGHIVNTASVAGLTAAPGLTPYAMTKHAVVGLSESLDAEVSPRGVHVSAICPGIINTPITRATSMHGALAPKRERIIRFYERFGASPDVVADAVLDAVRRNTLIRPVPRSHVLPAWYLRRLHPRAGQGLARLTTRLIGGR